MNVQGGQLNKLVDDMNDIYHKSGGKVGFSQKRCQWEELENE